MDFLYFGRFETGVARAECFSFFAQGTDVGNGAVDGDVIRLNVSRTLVRTAAFLEFLAAVASTDIIPLWFQVLILPVCIILT